jgi:diadenosine tetraphosphate (Ap4A) HIT family hydrolase
MTIHDERIFTNIAYERSEAGPAAPWDDTVRQDFHVAVFNDRYPCTPGHLLFVPQQNSKHVLRDAFVDAFDHGKQKVDTGEWDGFNIGLNYGEAAGQTVPWPHIHLIPRRKGDVPDPVGGGRNTLPGKGNYRKTPAPIRTLTGDSEGGDID